MIDEQKLFNALMNAVDDVHTEHVKVVDSFIFGDTEAPEIDLPKDRRIMWLEPYSGVYLVNLNAVRHFRKSVCSIRELFQSAVDSGYVVESSRWPVPTSSDLFEFQGNSSLDVAIVTMFSPKATIDIWYRCLEEIKIPNGVNVDVILGDNSGLDIVRNVADRIRENLSLKFRKVYVIDLGAPYLIKEGDHYLEMFKHAHVAVNYSKLLRQPASFYRYLLKLEDDMEPPEDGFLKLYFSMVEFERKKKKVACVAGYYPQKMDPTIPCLSMQPEIWGKIPTILEMQPRMIRVEMQGGGFALYRCDALREILPYTLTFKRPNGNFYMTGWDGSMGEEWNNLGWEQYCDGTLYCIHHF